jgi:hypothetical protein
MRNKLTVSLTMQDVYSVLGKLQEKSSAGPDNIPNVLLKRCRESLSWPLSILFTKSVDEGFLPQEWRDAVVTPVYKKGSKTTCGNYRPISLTCTAVKVMENWFAGPFSSMWKNTTSFATRSTGSAGILIVSFS